MKKIIKILALLCAIASIAAVIFYINLGELLATAVNKYGPKITKSEVTLEASDFSLFSKEAYLEGLVINNPQGFRQGTAFAIKKASIQLGDNLTQSDKPLTISKIYINGLELHWDGIKGDNVLQLAQNAQDYTGLSKAGEVGPNTDPKDIPTSSDEGKEKRPVIIEQVQIADTGLVLHYNIDTKQGLEKIIAGLNYLDIEPLEKINKSLQTAQAKTSKDILEQAHKLIHDGTQLINKLTNSITNDANEKLKKSLAASIEKLEKSLESKSLSLENISASTIKKINDLKEAALESSQNELAQSLEKSGELTIPIKIKSLEINDIEATEPALAIKQVLTNLSEQIVQNLKANKEDYEKAVLAKKDQIKDELKPVLKKLESDSKGLIEASKEESQLAYKKIADESQEDFKIFEAEVKQALKDYKDSNKNQLKDLEDQFKEDPEKAIEKAKDILKGLF